MIQPYTKVVVTDNTGAKEAMCIRILSRGAKRYAEIGGIINISIKSASPHSTVKKKEVCRAIIVRQKAPYRRKDGSTIRFDDNAVVVIDNNQMRGTRIFGPVAREIRDVGFTKIVSLAKEVL
ncbi:50S ribosomal protein L14 [Candidatus Berkelbacteria bacterium CG10_big_fil_rev_8_21_14_0_10_41_12]|uniref:Large ribosomal subunit protein uL14 n=1 Tax=Candidatus Berkelbacteria bacterium CG10_big_fil_rev_8_21_14_0_10_41_12 TaxID=1974513 RepID=A0A2M6WXX3_9BACT|nr:MAG: 50S ribosomal protein L14 [Candidatus Berkelbacteria bacterium CG10_big_fil_rev_8_21_14_0_10_41_12]